MASLEELTALINAKGEEIRAAKASNASKESISAMVAELLALKEKYKETNGGVPFDPPKAEPVKKVKEPAPETVKEKDGPSKKELNKQARKDRANQYKEPQKEETKATETTEKVQTTPAPVEQAQKVVASAVTVSAAQLLPKTITYSKGNVPELCRTVASMLNVDVSFSASASGVEHLPYLVEDTSKGSLSGDINISRYFARLSALSGGQDLYALSDPFLSSQVDEWLTIYGDMKSAGAATIPESLLSTLNGHLDLRTYLVGYGITMADVALTLAMKKLGFSSASNVQYQNVVRWFDHITTSLPFPKPLTSGASKSKAATSKASATSKAETDTPVVDANASGEEGTCPPLEDAVDGAVCTRFPPEPSGYLHIGHCKAVLLNQYYAQRYHGKLLIRFDDTNPSKEKEEYEENILKDLETLNVKGDKVSHTSDHFDICVEYAKKLIKDGNGYMDDTDQETMQKERLELKESKHRNNSPEENLRIFDLLLKGDPEASKYCLRAKIDMKSVNGTMRDPVMYRFNDTPHHRTGTKHKAYPTYDFACPIVDSIEGVTHALRTTEYNDRDEQYKWIIKALGLRDVKIMTYGKVNFVNTVLSKRKLNWFVEQGLVEGWFDPRFPTIQGCVRRGMNVEALKHFILSQGASRRVITMEWDKFWSENKKVLEESCPRYMAITKADQVKVILENVKPVVTGHTVQIHPQKPEHGTRVMRRSNVLLLDQSDAKTIKVNEEVTLLRWGNIKVRAIDMEGDLVKTIYANYDAQATNFSKTKKFTWLADIPELVPLTIVEFDHIITKPKLGEDDDFKNFVNPKSRSEFEALGDPILRTLVSGTVIQIERKGFFRIDKPYSNNGTTIKPAVLFAIPDGKVQKPSK